MKIAIGMGIAAFAYVLMVFGSLGLPKLAEVQAQGGSRSPSASLRGCWWPPT